MIRFLTPFKKREARVLLGLKDSANALCFKPDKTLHDREGVLYRDYIVNIFIKMMIYFLNTTPFQKQSLL